MLRHANKPMTDKKLDLCFEFFYQTVNTLKNLIWTVVIDMM